MTVPTPQMVMAVFDDGTKLQIKLLIMQMIVLLFMIFLLRSALIRCTSSPSISVKRAMEMIATTLMVNKAPETVRIQSNLDSQ
jgi:hypothetical protein